jgi:putative ABC transport system permease protein
MKVIIKIAWRNIWRNRVRSLVIITSVVLGLWAGTFVSAIYYGLGEDRVTIAIQSEISHIQIHNRGFSDDFKAKFILHYNDTVQHLLQNTLNVKAWTFRSKAHGMITSTTNSGGIQINGIDPAMEDSTTHLGDRIIEGTYFGPGKMSQVIVGKKLADKLKLKLKSKVVLTFLDRDDNLASGAFRVAGIFRSLNSTWDETNVFVKRADMNTLLAVDSDAGHEIAILLNNNRQIDTTVAQLKTDFPAYRVESWMQIAPEIQGIISVMDDASIIFIVIILLALSFGIVNTMLMAVLERTREIGMIIALGMTRLRVFAMVVIETFFLVMLGCPVGMLAAFGTIRYLNIHGWDYSSMAGQSISSMGFNTVLHPDLLWSGYQRIIILVILSALLAAILPAVKAVRLNPAETIKS